MSLRSSAAVQQRTAPATVLRSLPATRIFLTGISGSSLSMAKLATRAATAARAVQDRDGQAGPGPDCGREGVVHQAEVAAALVVRRLIARVLVVAFVLATVRPGDEGHFADVQVARSDVADGQRPVVAVTECDQPEVWRAGDAELRWRCRAGDGKRAWAAWVVAGDTDGGRVGAEASRLEAHDQVRCVARADQQWVGIHLGHRERRVRRGHTSDGERATSGVSDSERLVAETADADRPELTGTREGQHEAR